MLRTNLIFLLSELKREKLVRDPITSSLFLNT